MEELAKRLKARYRELVTINFAKDLYAELNTILNKMQDEGVNEDLDIFIADVCVMNNHIDQLRYLIADTILTHYKEES